MRFRDPASLPVRAAGPVLAAVHRPRGRPVAAKVARGLLVEGMAMMDADVHAWARERLIDVIYECDDDADAAADAVLAVLPELLTDERVTATVGWAIFDLIRELPEPPEAAAVGRVATAAAAEALAGVS